MKDHLLRGLLLGSGLVLMASIPARAQDYPKFQTSLGLSYLHLEGPPTCPASTVPLRGTLRDGAA